MIKKHQFIEIKRMLAEGKYSQRTIAKKIGVSRTAVKSVLLKILVETGHERRKERKTTSQGQGREIVFPVGKPKRCPRCGRLVQMPCLACQLHEIKRRKFERP